MIDGIELAGDNLWENLPHTPPYIASADRDAVTRDAVDHSALKLNCLPVPWIGDPRSASVLLLGLNPGWTPATEQLEQGVYAAENRLGLTFKSRVPMWNFDERLTGTPGHRWWSQRLRRIIETVGLQRVQTGVACVEWFPYHSERFRRLRLLLPSQAYGFSLVARAVDRGAVIVLMRSRALWLNSVAGLASADVLELKVPRSAYVTAKNLSAGGFERICSALETGTASAGID
jgi:hypothetical protein